MIVVSDTSPLTALLQVGQDGLLAKKAGHLTSVRQLIDDLHSKAGFFVSDALRKITLKAAGEEP